MGMNNNMQGGKAQGDKAAVQVKCDFPCLGGHDYIVTNDLLLDQVQVLKVGVETKQ